MIGGGEGPGICADDATEIPELGFEGGWVVEGGVPGNDFNVSGEFDEVGLSVDERRQEKYGEKKVGPEDAHNVALARHY